jgi:hypothetical protein
MLVASDIRAHAQIVSKLSFLSGRFLLAFGLAVVLDCYSVLMSVLSGLALWRKERYAVKLAQFYLISIPVVAYVGQALFSHWPPSKATDPEWVLRAVAGPLLWVWYLHSSRRVHNTYNPVVTANYRTAAAATAAHMAPEPSDTSNPSS